eukprot:1027191-Pyramimonas_sp.AAC.1
MWATPPVSAHDTHFRHIPHTFLVAQQGAPPKAPVAQPAYGRHPLFSTPLARFVAPQGAPPTVPVE